MKDNQLLYICEEAFSAKKVYFDFEDTIYSLRSEINNISKKYLFSIDNYRRLARKKILLKNKIPIYFSCELFLFYVKNKNICYWINYFNILGIYQKGKIIILFKNLVTLELDVSISVLNKELAKIGKVLEYIKDL